MARDSLPPLATTLDTNDQQRAIRSTAAVGPPKQYVWAKAIVLVGSVMTLVAAIVTPQRLWISVLANGQFLLGIGLGAAFFIAVLFATGACWGVAIRRVPEAMTALLLPGAVATLAVVFLHPSTWPWYGAPPTDDPTLWFRNGWLSLHFFQARSILYIALWLGLTSWMMQPSRRQDLDGNPEHTFTERRRAAGFLVVFALTVWLASTDWLMSLDPAWYSTVFGVYHFAGLFVAGIAAVTLAVVRLREAGPLRKVVTDEHLHDLGKLLLAFSTFWMYLWFCQFMLIWYANIPEETVYYIPRLTPWWLPLFLLNVAANWTIPFLVLLPREAKRRPAVLAMMSMLLLGGHWLDLYLSVSPRVMGARPAIGLAELGPLIMAIGVAVLTFNWAFRRQAPVPTRDPLFADSLSYHT